MRNNNRGVALILVLWILLALILLAAGISLMARTETQISRNYSDLLKCKWAARAGVYSALESLKTLNQQQTTYLGEEPYTVTSDDQSIDLGGYTFTSTIEDESAKVNINTAEADILTRIFESSEVSDCIIDWRDTDDVPGAQGAESDYYSGLQSPYLCRNASFETVRELQLVKGITESLLSEHMSDGTLPRIDLLTVYSPNSQTTSSNGSLVDIQSATRENLQSAFGDVLSSDDINAIINYRTGQAFKSAAEIVLVPGLDRSKIEQIYDKLTVSGTQAKSGLININTASADVLSVLPGLDRNIAQAVLNYRKDQGAFEGIGRLLEVKEMTNDAFINSAPYFTTRSTVFKITSTGRFESTGASATVTCIVEIQSSGKTQIKYWQE